MSDMENVAPIRPYGQRESWSTESSEYDVSRFYVTSNDSQTRVSRKLWLPASTDAQMVRLIQEGRIAEYRNHSDIVRDALIHRLHFINQLLKDGVLGTAITGQMRQAKLDAVLRNNEQGARYVESAIEGLQKASGNPSALRDLVETLESDLGDPTLSEADRGRLRSELAHYKGTIDGGE